MDVETKELIVGIVTDIDLVQYVSNKESNSAGASTRSSSEGEGEENEA